MPPSAASKRPGFRVRRAGERAARVSEELALEEALDDGGAVVGDETLVAPGSGLVQRARHQFLARTRLPGDERGAHVRRQPPDRVEQLLHDGASADHPAVFEALGRLAVRGKRVAAAIEAFADAREQFLQTFEVERLRDVVAGAELHRLDGALHRRLRGHEDDLARRRRLAHRAKDFEAADVRHLQIDQRGGGLRGGDHLERIAAVDGRRHAEAAALHEPLGRAANALVVVRDENQRRAGLLHGH